MENDPFTPTAEPDALSNIDNRPAIDPSKNYLEELVGDGKKFKSVEDLARGKAEADAFIQSLLREKQELREDLNKAKTVEDLLASLKGERDTTMTNHSNNSPNHGNASSGAIGGTGTDSLDLESIKQMVKQDLAKEQDAQRRRNNYENVVSTLTQAHGSQAGAYLANKAKELGVTTEYLRDLAEDKPQVLYSLLGSQQAASAPARRDVFTPPANQVNTPLGTSKPTGEHKTLSYYQALKAKDIKTYNSPKTMVQMHKDALALGDRFFDTNN